MPEEAFQVLDIYFTIFTHYLTLSFKWFYSLVIHSFDLFRIEP
jgi:hypothetical protein